MDEKNEAVALRYFLNTAIIDREIVATINSDLIGNSFIVDPITCENSKDFVNYRSLREFYSSNYTSDQLTQYFLLKDHEKRFHPSDHELPEVNKPKSEFAEGHSQYQILRTNKDLDTLKPSLHSSSRLIIAFSPTTKDIERIVEDNHRNIGFMRPIDVTCLEPLISVHDPITVELFNMTIGDRELNYFSQVDSLSELSLTNCKLKPSTDNITAILSARTLMLQETRFSVSISKWISNMPNLTSLFVGKSSMTSSILSDVSEGVRIKLESVDFQECDINDHVVASLCPSLNFIILDKTNVTCFGVREILVKCPNSKLSILGIDASPLEFSKLLLEDSEGRCRWGFSSD